MIATGQQVLYVATDLDTWETSTPEPDQDGMCEACGYRRLDSEYYAWLRHRMEVAKQAWQRGRLAAAQYQELRQRFNEVHFWAVAHLGEVALVAAVGRLDPKAYRPPQVQDWEPRPQSEQAPTQEHLFPADSDWPFVEVVTSEVVAQVDAIRDQALALGWSEAGLYQNRGLLRFPNGETYGLVCFLHGDSMIGEVTARFIEIISPRGSRLRHYNCGVQQPWVRRDQPEEGLAVPDISPDVPVCNRQENE
jgi:hypothetical protein